MFTKIASLALVFALTSAVQMKPQKRPQISAEDLATYDVDGDGKLNRDERAAMKAAKKEEKRQERLDRCDENGDGEISEEEKAACKAQKQEEAFN